MASFIRVQRAVDHVRIITGYLLSRKGHFSLQRQMAPVKADLEQARAVFKHMMALPAFGSSSNIDSMQVEAIEYDAEDDGDRRLVRSARLEHSAIAQQEWTNQRGLAVHGGFTAWLVDTCSSALMIGLSTPTFWHQTGGVSLNINMNYYHPITVDENVDDSGTKLRIISKLIKVSNTIAWIQCDIFDDNGKLLASGLHTKSHPAAKAKL